jgi:hypothetical protein
VRPDEFVLTGILPVLRDLFWGHKVHDVPIAIGTLRTLRIFHAIGQTFQCIGIVSINTSPYY